MKLTKMLSKPLAMLAKPLKMLDNPIVSNGIKLFLVLYAAMIAPKLPEFMIKLLKNPLVKISILFAVIYTGIKDPVMSLLIAIGFTISMLTLNKLETVGNLNQLIDGAIDAPQSLLNDLIDGGQGLTTMGADLIGSPITDVVGVANKVIDSVQEVTNTVIDGAQKLVKSVVGEDKSEDFTMEDRTMTTDIVMKEMGELDGLSGYSEPMLGAEL